MTDRSNGAPELRRSHLLNFLAQIEAFAEEKGWRHPPALIAIANTPVPGTDDEWRLASDSVEVPNDAWAPSKGGPLEVLRNILTSIRSPHAQAVAALLAHNNPDSRIVAWAFVYIAQSEQGEEARLIDAADEQGCLYRIVRRRDSTPEGEFDEDGSTYANTPIHQILVQLVETALL